MKIANIVTDSIVDGPGLRLTIFTQGCVHHCPGCHNPDTHDPAGGQEIALEEILLKIRGSRLIEGITLSGGEPFLQAENCALLARAAHEAGLTVWVYTGYHYEMIQAIQNPHWSDLLAETDVLVDGPFLESQKSLALPFRGSRNQRLIDMRKTRESGDIVLWSKSDGLDHFTIPT